MFFSKITQSISDLKRQLKSPEFLEGYTNLGLAVANYTVASLNKLLLSLLKIQGLDPASQPGEKVLKLYKQALESAFTYRYPESYDKDFSWAKKQFANLKDHKIDITEERFEKITNLNNWTGPSQPLSDNRTVFVQATPGSNPKETDTTSAISSDSSTAISSDSSTEDNRVVSIPADPLDQLSGFLQHTNLNGSSHQEDHERSVDNSSNTESDTVSRDMATELAHLMSLRGLCSTEHLDAQINEIMNFDKAMFNSLQKIALHHPLRTDKPKVIHVDNLPNEPDKFRSFSQKLAEKYDALGEMRLKETLEILKKYAEVLDPFTQDPLYKEADALNIKLLDKEICISDFPELVNQGLSQKVVDYWWKYFCTGFEAKTKKDLGDFGGTFSRINNKKNG